MKFRNIGASRATVPLLRYAPLTWHVLKCLLAEKLLPTEFSKSIIFLGICIDKNLNFDFHIKDICLKASRQFSALQRLTGLLDLASRKAIYTSFISSNFNYSPLAWCLPSGASINKVQKLQERALRFVLNDSNSDCETLLSKNDFDSYRISSIKLMAVEIYNILSGMGPEYLSTLFSKSNVPYQLGYGNKLIQPLKRRSTFPYSDVIMSTTEFQITSLTIVYSTVHSGADQRKHQAPSHWPLWEEFTSDWWIPGTKGQ